MVGLGVFRAREPTEEVGGLVVERIWDEMVADAVFTGCRVCWTVTIECKRHEEMAVPDSCCSQTWIRRTTAITFVLHTRAKIVRNLLSLRVEEIAVRVCPTDDAAGVVKGYLLAALVEEPDAR